jgi:4-amino-4-deoxy-L-arabinose transferase-like glycosyltransferase
MVVLAFALRWLMIIVKHTYRVSSVDPLTTIPHFKFGFENGMVAGSIASGMGFSSPFGGATGQTAWLAPVYPYLTAGVFKIFGLYSESSGFVLLTLNALFSALTCIPIYLIACRFSSARVAKWTVLLWAVLPMAMYWSIRWVWETSLSALMLTTALWLTFQLEKDGRIRSWILWGGVWGVLALTNPACCSILPFAGLWICWRRWRLGVRWLAPVTIAALTFIVVITPWEVRNYATFHRVLMIRGNAAAELRMGNGPGSVGLWMAWAHPSQDPTQLAEFRRLGERAYIDKKGNQAADFIWEDPRRFVRLCVARMVYFWAGVPRPSASAVNGALHNWFFMLVSILSLGGLISLIRQRIPGVFVLLSATAFYPITYYITFPDPRYRHAIEPILVFLGTHLVFQAREFQREAAHDAAEVAEEDIGSLAA